jgi:hypothetical protein
MRALVIHESLTGNTREAARRIVAELISEGWQASECSSREVDLAALQAADVLVVGSWVDGLFLVGQRPGGSGKLAKLPLLGNKPTYVYVTYALDPGKTLQKLTTLIEERDGHVVGGMTIKRNALVEGSIEFAHRVVDAAASDVVASS